MAITRNSFEGGMQKDLAKTKLNQHVYDDALNIRMLTDTGKSSMAIANIRGNKLFFTLPNTTEVIRIDLSLGFTPYTITFNGNNYTFNTTATTLIQINIELTIFLNTISGLKAFNYGSYISVYSPQYISLSTFSISNGTLTTLIAPQSNLTIIGWTTIRDTFILLTTSETNINPTGSNVSQIWKLDYDKSILQTNPTGSTTLTLLYNNILDLSLSHPIVSPGNILGNYENIDIQKIYWCDYYNQRRFFNIADPNGFFLFPEELFSKPVVTFDIPYMTGIIEGIGNLTAGLYYITYRYKNITGATTEFSPPSQLTTVVSDIETISDIKTYSGDMTSPATGITKTLQFRIDNLDTRFDRIQVAYVRWTDSNNITNSPDDIGIFLDEPVIAGVLDINYSGFEKVETVTIDEYLITDRSPDIHKTLTSKDNMLLIGNVKTKKLDLEITPGVPFDCRAIRYTAKNATVNPLTTYTIGILPDQLNDINPNQSPISRNNYIYQSDGITLGGTGLDPGTGLPNISYKFVTESYHLDSHVITGIPIPAIVDPGYDASNFATLNGKNYNNINFFKTPASPLGIGVLRGYQRNEIYRFGIVFYDKNGNSSWVKWIADIQFPDFYMPVLTTVDPQDRTLQFPLIGNPSGDLINYYSNSLGIEFTINNLNLISNQISGYSIVRVKRTQQDKTMLAQGAMSVCQADAFGAPFTIYGSTVGVDPYNTLKGNQWSSTYAAFYSADTMFSKPNIINFNTNLEVTGVYNDVQEQNMYIDATTINPDTSVQKTIIDLNPIATVNTIQSTSAAKGATAITRKFQIQNNGYFERYPDDNQHFIGANNVRNRAPTSSSQGNKSLILQLNSPNFAYIWNVNDPNFAAKYSAADQIDATDKIYGARLTQIVSNQYSGNTVTQKSNNEYIYCNHYNQVTSSSTTVKSEIFGGDVWINLFDFVKEFKSWDITFGGTREAWGYVIPIESSINTALRESTANVLNRSFVPNVGTGTTLATYEGFSIRSVIANEHQVIKFLPKPVPFITNTDFDTRVYHSQVKIQGELGESWGVFKDADYKDVESIYGPINNIATIKNQLYFWQDKAFGIIPVNRRVLLQDTTSSTLQLGAGQVLEKHEYITNQIGCKHQSSIVVTDKAAYWYDVLDNKQVEFTQAGVNPYSDLKGFHSYLDTNIKGDLLTNDNVLLDKGVNGYYDYKYNEVVHTFHDIINRLNQKFTICYNTLTNTYSSFYSFQPTVYVTDKYITFSHNNSNKKLNFVHDYGDYGNFYDQYYDSSIKFLTNQNPNLTKVFNNIDLQTEVQLSNIDTSAGLFPVQETINKIRFTNDTQDSGLVTLTSGVDIKRKFRTWRTDIDRDINNSSVISFGYKSRMRDKYLYTELFYTNNGNKRWILHDVILGFTPSPY